MKSVAKNSPVLPFLPWLGLAVALGVLGWDTAARSRRSLHLSETYGVAVNAPRPDAASPTGYELGRRSLLLPVLAPDAQHWIMQTQAMRAAGEWRVRAVDYDNAPEGRDVHWGSPWRWWMLLIAHADRAISGVAMPIAIERSALWAGPALLAILLLALVPFAARRFGVAGSVVLAFGLVGTSPLAVQFVAGNGDHHGLVIACAMATVGCLLVAGAAPEMASSRRWFAGSALAGAVGLWVSAASFVPVLIGIGVGALAAMPGARRRGTDSADATVQPELWRWWGAWGAAGSLVAYLIEYAPAHFSWRLEVNHPLYALAWLCAGELLCRSARAACGRGFPARVGAPLVGALGRRQATPLKKRQPAADAKVKWRAHEMALGIAALSGVLLVPLLVLTLGERVFLPANEFLAALHADHIAEFSGLMRFLASRPFDLASLSGLMPPVAAAAALVIGFRGQTSQEDRARLALAAGPALVMLGLTIVQIRWWGLASALVLLFLLVATATQVRSTGGGNGRGVVRLGLVLLFVPGLFGAIRHAWLARLPIEGDVRRLAERDVAHRLRLRVGDEPFVIAATPDKTTSLIHHAGARGLGTLYWENLAGLKTAAALFGAASAEEARQLIARTGAEFIVLFSWDTTEDMCVRLHRGLTRDEALPQDAFVLGLHEGRVPNWLRPIAHRLPPHPLLRNEQVLVFEVTEPRSPDVVAVDVATFFLESGDAAGAQRIESELARHPQSLAATAALAGLQARRRDAPAFGATMNRVMELLPRADALPLEDQVRVAMALGLAGRDTQAAGVLRVALAGADERAVRRLTPGILADLAALADVLGVTFPSAELRQLAAELMPPQ